MSKMDDHQLQQQMTWQLVAVMLVAVIVLWGLNVILIKYLIRFFPPLALAGIRITLAAAFLLPVSLWKYGVVIPPRRMWPPIIGIAILSIILHQIALSIGLSATSATHSVLILALNPLVTMLLASRMVNEPLSSVKLIGAMAGLSGILLIVFNRTDAAASTLIGDGIILIAMIAYVLGSLCVKKSTQQLPPIMVTAYSHALGAIGLVALGGAFHTTWINPEAVAVWPLTLLVFSGCICTGLATIWWNMGIHSVGASTTALFINGQPIVGIFASVVFLGEHLAWQHFIALLLVILGVGLGTGAIGKLLGERSYSKPVKG